MNALFVRFGIGGGLSGAAIYALGATNPVSLVALAALGQGVAWLPEAVRRCFRHPVAANPVSHPVAAKQESGVDRNLDRYAEDLAKAIERSLEPEVKFDDFKDEDFEGTGESCKYSENLGSHEQIPNGMILSFNRSLCNAGVFLQMLLAQENCERDSLTQARIDSETIEEATKLAGIDAALFPFIWDQALADYPNGGMTEEEAEEARNGRRDLRAGLFAGLLSSNDGTPDQILKRERFIQYYAFEQRDWWEAALKASQEN